MMRRISLACALTCLLATPAGAEPSFAEPRGAEVIWEDGPSGCFRPYAGAGPGSTWYVDGEHGSDGGAGDAGSPFATISRALELVAAGDTVVVRAGTYTEQVRPGDLASPASPARPVTLLADGEVVLNGDGAATEIEGGLEHAAGVSLYRDSAFVIQGFTVRGWPGYGAAVQQSSDSRILDCRFEDNGADMNDPTHLILLSSRDVRVLGCDFTAAEHCLEDRSTDSWIAHNSFSGCTANAVKIGPHPAGKGCRLQHNRFVDNPGTQGVILLGDAQGVSVQRNLLATGSLAGIRLDGVVDCRVLLNTVTGFQIGLQLRNLESSRVAGNIAAHNTVGVEFLSYLHAGVVDYNLYFGNSADTDGTGEPGPNARFGDPDFVDPAGGDYGLGADSDAADAGPPDLPVPEGGGSSVDLGAHERGAGEAPYSYQVQGQVADPTPAFSWDYADSDGGAQRAFRVQIDRSPVFDSPELVDSNWQESPQTSWTVPRDCEPGLGIWYVRVQTQDAQARSGPWSDPHLAFELVEPPSCAAQSGSACDALDACDGEWLVAADEPRCCDGSCVPCPDADSDGYLDQSCGGADCDDGDPAVNPDADEDCENGADDDCDGMTDLDDSECGCVDHDRDGYGEHCEAGPDCDDGIASVHPGAVEECNYVDDDCDGETDEGFDLERDPDNCGECAWACRAEEVCDLGSCESSCGGGRIDCDRSCIDTSADMENCGGCGAVCDLPHASETCAQGECVLSLCETGWVDLDGEAENGCEYECTVAGDETCDNGVDDDCDGQVDEDCGGGGCSCASSHAAASLTWLFFLLAARRYSDRSPNGAR
ncbi:MAG: right-handed parallel beta-helix repeat-containing protein [Deltaproteobacteria bacterium]|nr:right-handed parallel beta-helix repeat-containing protein [Deltaproteobacteria bacterium]